MPKKFFAVILLTLLTSISARSDDDAVVARIKALESRCGGRFGVAALDTGSGERVSYRGDERFPMCSTFKVLLAGAVLHRVEKGDEKLDRVVSYTEADLLSYAPITKQHVAEGGMTIEALCDAIIRYSDNTAANLLLDTLGGPAGLTAYVRSLGDKITRLDRKEEALNEITPGDERDTTSPTAMLGTLRTLLLGDALSASSHEKLEAWMRANTTGDRLIRAGAPRDWQVGDKTGRSSAGTVNDVAIVRPPNRAPILLCIFSTEAKATSAEQEKAIAEIASAILK